MRRDSVRWRGVGLATALALAALLALGACASGDFVSEGSATAPVDVGTAPTTYEGQVGTDASSYYTSTVTVSTSHLISLTNLDDDADLAVYTDAAFSVSFCASLHSGTTNESCNATTDASTSVLYILVKPSTTQGTGYLLSVN